VTEKTPILEYAWAPPGFFLGFLFLSFSSHTRLIRWRQTSRRERQWNPVRNKPRRAAVRLRKRPGAGAPVRNLFSFSSLFFGAGAPAVFLFSSSFSFFFYFSLMKMKCEARKRHRQKKRNGRKSQRGLQARPPGPPALGPLLVFNERWTLSFVLSLAFIQLKTGAGDGEIEKMGVEREGKRSKKPAINNKNPAFLLFQSSLSNARLRQSFLSLQSFISFRWVYFFLSSLLTH